MTAVYRTSGLTIITRLLILICVFLVCMCYDMSCVMRKPEFFSMGKTKEQIICAATAQLISAFVFTTQVEQSLCFVNQKFQASSLLL